MTDRGDAGPPATAVRSGARVRVAGWSVLAVFVALLGARVGRAFFVEARVPLAWFLAAAVVAVLISPVIAVAERHLWRPLAVGATVVLLVAVVLLIGAAVFDDLNDQVDSLRDALPDAAERIEGDERFGEIARDLRLAERVDEVVDVLDERVTGEARSTVASASSYLIAGIFMLFLLSWGPRWFESAMALLGPDRGPRLGHALLLAVRAARAYVGASLATGLAVAVIAWTAFRLADLPAPTPLAVWLGVWAMVPYFGVAVGAVPATLLSVGLLSATRTVPLIVMFVVLQFAVIRLHRSIVARTLYVGPAIVLVAGLLGQALYGFGGALYAAALAVFGAALLDVAATEAAAPGPRRPS